MFQREGLLATRPTPKLEDQPLSAVHDCLFNLFAATLHIGGRFSIRKLRTRHAVVTGTHYTWGLSCLQENIFRNMLAPPLSYMSYGLDSCLSDAAYELKLPIKFFGMFHGALKWLTFSFTDILST